MGGSPIVDTPDSIRTIDHLTGSFPLLPGLSMKHATAPDSPLARHSA
jgi:hypothetical protein